MFTRNTPFFIFDVESVGLHGIHFAVAGGVYIDGEAQWEFHHGCPIDYAALCEEHLKDDVKWVKENVKHHIDCPTPGHVTDAFWMEYRKAKSEYPDIQIAAECLWPVEGRLFNKVIDWNKGNRNWDGPYPFHEIASIMACAGFDPMETWVRENHELPAHNPLADARLSARILRESLLRIESMHQSSYNKYLK